MNRTSPGADARSLTSQPIGATPGAADEAWDGTAVIWNQRASPQIRAGADECPILDAKLKHAILAWGCVGAMIDRACCSYSRDEDAYAALVIDS
jgi:hypothetical protein